MATVKIFLRKTRYKDGTYPLVLRITKDRKSAYVHLGYSVHQKDWDDKTQRVRKAHPNSVRLNNLIAKKLADAGDMAIDIETHHSEVSSKHIMRKIKPAADAMFFAQARLYLQRLKDEGNFNRWKADTPRIRNFKEFVLGTDAVRGELPKSHARTSMKGILSGEDAPFSQIDVSVLSLFRTYLKAQLRLSDRTVANYLMVIQAIFSQAIREGVSDKKYFPFGTEKIRIKLPESQKIGLTREDVEKLESVELPNQPQSMARDLWLTSFYFAGMRAADVLQLKWSDFKDGRLHYIMDKNGKPGSLKVPQRATEVLKSYIELKEGRDSYVFPYLKGFEQSTDAFDLKRRISSLISQIDKLLKLRVAPASGIEGKLSLHIARHTFATLAGDKIPIQMLQKLYRHSDIKTTLGYQANFIHRDADEALDAVIDGE